MFKRGDIYYTNLGPATDRCTCGVRPVVIVSNDTANAYSPTVTVIPMTSLMKKRNQPTHVILRRKDASGLTRPSMVLCEQVRSIDKEKLGMRVGRIISQDAMEEIAHALQVQIGIICPNGRLKVD